MRKCLKCQLVFHTDNLERCPSCNGALTVASAAEVQSAKAMPHQGGSDLNRLVHFVGSYFRAKSFAFNYSLARCEMKIGKGYSRLFVYPPDWGFLVRLPWLMVDMADSLLFRFIYTGFCDKCGWKYPKISGGLSHSPQECEYHQEYTAILGSIASGKIPEQATAFQQQSVEKLRLGKKSAWHDFSQRNLGFELGVDVISIFLTLGLLIFGVIRLAMPIFAMIYDFEY